MDQKKLIQTVIIFIVALWVFCASLMISVSVARKADSKSTTTALQTTTIPSTTEPSTVPSTTTTSPSTSNTAPSTPQIIIDNNVNSTVQVDDPDWKVSYDASVSQSKHEEEINKNVPVGKDNIVKAYVDGINKLKSTENFTMETTGSLDISFDQITGGSVAENMASNAVAENQPKNTTYTFVRGVDSQSGETPLTTVPPSRTYAKLSSDAVKQATAAPTGDGGFKIILILNDEKQTLSSPAANHASAIESFEMDGFMPSGVELNSLDITYSGATVEVIFDKDCRVTSISYTLPISNAEGSGVYDFFGGIDFNFSLHGSQTRTCTITY